MVCDTLRKPETFEAPNSNNMEEPPNEDTQRFYNLLVEANEPFTKGQQTQNYQYPQGF